VTARDTDGRDAGATDDGAPEPDPGRTMPDVTPAAHVEDGGDEPKLPRRRLQDILLELWHQKPGPRESSRNADPKLLPPGKEIVDKLDRRERLLGYVSVVLAAVLTILGYFADRHSTVANDRKFATSLLLAGLVVSGILLLGTLLRRRALLGFASFIAGMQMISFSDVTGILYLFFGGWLIVRVMRKQRHDQAVAKLAGTGGASVAKATKAAVPAPSARYTPPKRARARAGARATPARKR